MRDPHPCDPSRPRHRSVTVVTVGMVLGALVVTAACGDTAASPEPEEALVTMVGSRFVPDALRVARGGRVRFVNEDVPDHTVTATDGSFDSGRLGRDDRFEVVADGGSFDFVCTLHPTMTGSVEVVGGQ